jgi:zinc protease
MPRATLLLPLLLLLLAPTADAAAGELVTRYDLATGIGETEFANGLRVLTLERHNAPVVSCQIWYGVGSADELPGQTGLAHFLEHLMFKGTDRYAKGEIDRLTLRLGGSNNAGTTKDWTYYYFNLASDRFLTALEIEVNRMRNLAFDPEEFEAERRVVIEELQIGRDGPWTELDETLEAVAYTAHPYKNPVIGWRKDLERITREEVRDFYRRHYHPGNAILVLVGDFDTRTTLQHVSRLFKDVPAGPADIGRRSEEPAQNGERSLIIHRDAELARFEAIYHSLRAGDRDDATLDVLSEIMVGGKASRLVERLAEKDQSVTFVTAGNDTREDPGLFWIWAELREGQQPAAVQEALFQEVERLRTDLVTQDELDRAKSALLSRLVFGRATAEDLATQIGYLATVADWRLVGSAAERLAAVTAEDVRRVAGTVLAPTNRTVGWELPGGKGQPSKPPSDPARRSPRAGGGAAPGGPAVRLSPTVVKLENGLTLLLSRHTTVPVTALSVYVDAGVLREPRPGIALLTGRYLLEGAGELDANGLASALARIGATVTTSGVGLNARCLTKDAPEMVTLVADLLLEPTFPESSFEKLRERQISEIRSEADDPKETARLAFRAAVYGDHPYGHSAKGTEESLGLTTLAQVVRHHRSFYGPDNIVIAAVSDLPVAELREMLEEAFAEARPRYAPPQKPPAAIPTPQAGVIRLARDTDQANIFVGHIGIPRAHEDYYSLLVMDYVLGLSPGFTDRLSRTLRDRDGLAYEVYATIATTARVEPGTFYAFIGTSAHQGDRAIEGIVKEIERIRTENVTPEELADSKAYLTGSFVFRYETAEQIARNLVYLHHHRLGFDYPTTFARRIEEVTAEDIRAAANHHLFPDRLIRVIVGPVK